MIEFTNRAFSGIVALGTIAAGLLAFFRVPPRRDLKILGLMLPLGVVAQAVLGGLSVVYDLKPGFVMGHYALSLLLLIAAWALYWRSKPEYEAGLIEPGAPDRLTMWATRLLLPLGALMVVAGTAATAAGPHAGGVGHRRPRRAPLREGQRHAELGGRQPHDDRDRLRPRGARGARHRLVPAGLARAAARARDGRRAARRAGPDRRDPVPVAASRRARLGPRLPGDDHLGRAAVGVERGRHAAA